MTLPTRTLEWSGLAFKFFWLRFGGSNSHTVDILVGLTRRATRYDHNVDIEAYDMEPVAKSVCKDRRKLCVSHRCATLEIEAQGFDHIHLHVVWAGGGQVRMVP